MPVESPHANGAQPSSGASGFTLASAISGITVYSANVDVPMKWRSGSPFRLNRVVPSGRKPSPCWSRIATQRFVRALRQWMHFAALRREQRDHVVAGRDERHAVAHAARRRPPPRVRARTACSRSDRRPTRCRGPCGRRRTRRAGRAPRPPAARRARPPGRRAAARTPRGRRREPSRAIDRVAQPNRWRTSTRVPSTPSAAAITSAASGSAHHQPSACVRDERAERDGGERSRCEREHGVPAQRGAFEARRDLALAEAEHRQHERARPRRARRRTSTSRRAIRRPVRARPGRRCTPRSGASRPRSPPARAVRPAPPPPGCAARG